MAKKIKKDAEQVETVETENIVEAQVEEPVAEEPAVADAPVAEEPAVVEEPAVAEEPVKEEAKPEKKSASCCIKPKKEPKVNPNQFYGAY